MIFFKYYYNYVDDTNYPQMIENLKKWWLYEMLEKITSKNKKSIKQYFWRNKLKIDDAKDFINYINKYGNKKT